MSLPSAERKCQFSYWQSKNSSELTSLCAPKVIQEVNFPNFLERLYTGWIVVVHLDSGFSLWRQMAPQQSAKFRSAFFGQFRTSLRNDSIANYASIWTQFTTSVTGTNALCNALNTSQIRLQVAPQDSENCGRNFAKRKQSDAEFAGKRLLRMVIIDMYSNYHHSRQTDTRSCRYALSFVGRCFCFQFVFFLSRSESGAPCVRGVHSSNTHCVAIYRRISTRFPAFFQAGIALSDMLHSSHICRQVASQFSVNCGQKLRKVQKSAEKFVRNRLVQIAEGFEKYSNAVVQGWDCRCAPI